MNTSRDPFGFGPKPETKATSISTSIIVAQPGQEVRIVVPDRSGAIPGFGDNRASPSGSGDSRASPSGSGDSRASPSGSGDSRASPSGKGDLFSQDAFGFKTYRRGFSPAPMTIVVQPGQELRVVVADSDGRILPGALPGDSRASPSGKGDIR